MPAECAKCGTALEGKASFLFDGKSLCAECLAEVDGGVVPQMQMPAVAQVKEPPLSGMGSSIALSLVGLLAVAAGLAVGALAFLGGPTGLLTALPLAGGAIVLGLVLLGLSSVIMLLRDIAKHVRAQGGEHRGRSN